MTSNATIRQEHEWRRAAARRAALVLWCVYVAGAFLLTVVATILGHGIWPRVSNAGEGLSWVVFVMALAFLLVSRLLPMPIQPPPRATVETMTAARSFVPMAFNGTFALLASLTWMVSGKLIALVALGSALSVCCSCSRPTGAGKISARALSRRSVMSLRPRPIPLRHCRPVRGR